MATLAMLIPPIIEYGISSHFFVCYLTLFLGYSDYSKSAVPHDSQIKALSIMGPLYLERPI